jgi:hypothetical protein
VGEVERAGRERLPPLAWHAHHDWAMFEMSRNLRREHSGVAVGIAFLPLQFLLMNPVTAPVWLSGLVRLWRDPDCRRNTRPPRTAN